MDKRNLLIFAVVLLICILGFVSWEISTVSYGMEIECINEFDVNGTCPCFPSKPVDGGFLVINVSIPPLVS